MLSGSVLCGGGPEWRSNGGCFMWWNGGSFSVFIHILTFFFYVYMVVEVSYCDAGMVSQVHIGQESTSSGDVSVDSVDGVWVNVSVGYGDLCIALRQVSEAFSVTLQTSCPTLSCCALRCEGVPKLRSESRVNVPIKLTKIYIETILVHKISVSVQKVMLKKISHTIIFNFILQKHFY